MCRKKLTLTTSLNIPLPFLGLLLSSLALNLSFLLRVDSAFICLGTTRAKAGAEGFVKVHIHLHCRDGTL